MIDLKRHTTVISITNLTGETMRDIILTYDGDSNPIEILKIKNKYEKVVFLHIDDNDDLFNLNMLYKGKEYTVYKNIDINSDVDIKLKITKDENDSDKVNIKSFLYIR